VDARTEGRVAQTKVQGLLLLLLSCIVFCMLLLLFAPYSSLGRCQGGAVQVQTAVAAAWFRKDLHTPDAASVAHGVPVRCAGLFMRWD
jgi:hypothetical protein